MDLFPASDLEQRSALLDEWVELQREIARLESRAADVIWQSAQVMDADANANPHFREAIYRSTHAEHAAAGRISTFAAENAFTDVRVLQRQLPGVRAAFAEGAVTARHVHEIVAAATIVNLAIADGRADADTMRLFDVAATVIAETETVWRTRSAVKTLAASLAGDTVVERQRRAKDERGVSVRPVGDGLALLQVVLPEHLARAILDRLTRMGKEVISARDEHEPVLDPDELDPGTLDSGDPAPRPSDIDPADPASDAARRSDDVIFGESGTFTRDPFDDDRRDDAAQPRGRFIVDDAGEMVWCGDQCTADDVEHAAADTRTLDQIRADIVTDLLLAADPSAVRDLAARNGLWTRLFVDPDGMVTATDAYTPTANMKRFLRARDQRCRFPGCQTPALDTQIDHNHDWAKGGRTELGNLALLCPGHHVLKHPDIDERYRWYAQARPGGDIEWTSPLGRTYLDAPPRRVMFT